ncbi:hypothetical protein L6V77_19000 [Myxococcota bacterium]|nr:hypothetical protein [Myxococcota bacterium]
MSARNALLSVAALLLLVATLVGTPGRATATPLYTVREGRTCDNCHALPNDWVDPPEMARRKCTLSCSGCHVDPGGGGLRTVSGVYFGRSTLPMFWAVDRPWADKKAHGEYVEPEVSSAGSQPLSSAGSQPLSSAGSQPLSSAGSQPLSSAPTAPPKPTGGLAFGRPLDGGGAEMAFLDGRYGDLNADALLRLGADLRLGAWTAGPKVFPMQGDAYAAVHPKEHLTLSTTVGLRGRIRGPAADDPDGQSRFGVRDLWLMTHEWPMNTYARVGRFLPQFGWRLDDHTAYTRRPFGLSQEDPANRIIGAEFGFNGNYPYANIAAWVPGSRRPDNPFEPTDGYGGALNAGYRDLGWQVGASAMLRSRPEGAGGDTKDASLQWGFNPWFYWPTLPVAYLGEVAYGTLERPYSGRGTAQHAWFHDVSWLPRPGITLHARHDFWDPDHEIRDDEFHRAGLGVEWVPIPSLTARLDVRRAFTAVGSGGADGFLQLHGWF